ncbi:C45 family peptidase [Microbacterium sp. Au-Mic1]|uniref:C45 family autoproteolytic acyltransferase/hydolase n=1 Tax=Microbacterium sp. Au-Mic1 TaxID=2906457 RepID=UPI001E63F224|nr:C45 family peptidase [Microbacterium sp. Au-Mic1]MCE4027550.1 C45 family peptidase [Microbacterium sp. Au-Mic1]
MRLLTLTSSSTDPRERGRSIGRTHPEAVRRSAALYRAHFADLGIDLDLADEIARRSHNLLRQWHAPLAEESDAMADAAGVDRLLVAAVGARTEILAAAEPQREGECSTAVHVPSTGSAETIQTWDWHATLVPFGLLLDYAPAAGRRAKLFTEFGTAAKIGVNSAGLGLHFNILSHREDAATGGVPVHAIARRIIDEADTVADAIALAASATVSASTVFTVTERGTADRAPQAASVEVSPAGVAVVRPGDDGWLLHTNHFLDHGLSAGDTMPADSTTAERYSHLAAMKAGMTGLDPLGRAAAMCGDDGEGAAVCMRPELDKPSHEQWETLLTIGIDAASTHLDVYPGTPADAARHGMTRF